MCYEIFVHSGLAFEVIESFMEDSSWITSCAFLQVIHNMREIIVIEMLLIHFKVSRSDRTSPDCH